MVDEAITHPILPKTTKIIGSRGDYPHLLQILYNFQDNLISRGWAPKVDK